MRNKILIFAQIYSGGKLGEWFDGGQQKVLIANFFSRRRAQVLAAKPACHQSP